MEQLTGTESLFLHVERGNLYNHVAALGIYDPSSAPGGSVRYKDILRHFADRLGGNAIFRRRLATVPFGLDRPYWIDEPAIDLEFHIRHIALPHPGDWRQLMIQVARLHSRPLDRSRPLWEVYVIEGLSRIPDLPSASFAIFTKFHHASVDGMAAIEVIAGMHATTAGRARRRPPRKAVDADAEPFGAELYASALRHGVARALGMSRFVLEGARKVAGIAIDEAARRAGVARGGADAPPALPSFAKAPLTRFSRPVSANRVVEAIGIPLAAMKRLRTKVEGVTVNDVFLAIVGGALRRYLFAKNELPERSLVALMPISLRVDAKAGGNDVGGVPVQVRSDIADPIERLRAVRDAAQQAKRQADIMGKDFAKSVFEALPHVAAELFMTRVLIPQLNVAVSNVRGPEAPLFVAGARLARLYPVSVPADGVGLNHTAISYDGMMWMSMVACRNMMPDPAFYAGCMRESFDELAAAAAALPAPVEPASRPGRGATPRPAAAKRSAAAAKRRGHQGGVADPR